MRHVLAGLGLFTLAAGFSPPAAAQTVSLAGTWKLNLEQSEDPRAKVQEATEKGPSARTGMTSGGRVRTGAGRIDGESGGGSKPGGVSTLPGAEFARIMRPAEAITVEQNDTTLVIRDDRGLPQVYYLDGRKIEEMTGGSEPSITTAKWKDGKLSVERKLGGIGSIREVYLLDTAKKRLVVEAKATSTQLGTTVEIRRVYDAGN